MLINKSLRLELLFWLAAISLSYGQPLSTDPAVKIGKLSNGFTYYIQRNTQPQNRVTLYLANRVGSILETEEERGLAHFLEHMNFNGTTHFPKNELIHYLEKSGVKFGADLNAYTGTDETIYQLPLPTDDKTLLKNGLLIMRDWAAGALLDPEEFTKERGVILEEKRLKQSASQRMRDQYLPLLLNGSRYADRQPIGLDRVIETASVASIRAFYRRWYRPDLQALIIVGDIDVKQMEAQVKTLFGDLTLPKPAPIRPTYSIPLREKASFAKVTDPEYNQTAIRILFKSRKRPVTTHAAYRQQLLQRLTQTMLTQRWQAINHQANPAFISGAMEFSSLMGDLQALTATVVLKPGQVQSGFQAFWQEVLRLQEFSFAEAELEGAKAQLTDQFRSLIAEQNRIPSSYYAEKYAAQFTEKTVALSLSDEQKLIESILPLFTIADLRTYLTNELQQPDQTTLVLGSDKLAQQLPDAQQLEAWKVDVQQDKRITYQPIQQVDNLMTQKPKAGNVTKVVRIDSLQIDIWTLSNGMRVVVKPTTHMNNQILFTSFSPGGTSLYELADYPSASQAALLVSASGAGTLDTRQLTNFLQTRKLQVHPYIDERYQGMAGSTTIQYMEQAFQLINLYWQHPRVDTALFANIIDRSKAALSVSRTDPEQVFSDTISAVLSDYNPRRKPLKAADLDRINLNRVLTIYQERFADAASTTFVFTGSINSVSLRPFVETYLASLPATYQQTVARDLKIRIPKGKLRKDIYVGAGDKAEVQLVISDEYLYSEANNLTLKAFRSILNDRLLERIREQAGGAYSPSVQLTKAKEPLGFYVLIIHFGCQASRVDELAGAALEECEKLRRDGPTEDELAKFKAEERRSHELDQQSNRYWLAYLSDQLKTGDPLTAALTYVDQLNALSIAHIKKQAFALLNMNNVITLTSRPTPVEK